MRAARQVEHHPRPARRASPLHYATRRRRRAGRAAARLAVDLVRMAARDAAARRRATASSRPTCAASATARGRRRLRQEDRSPPTSGSCSRERWACAAGTSSATTGAGRWRSRSRRRIPRRSRTLTIVDVTLPGIGPDISQGGKRWHHAFHMTPDLPEALVQGRERAYLSWFYESFSWRRGAFDAADIDEYLRTYTPAGRAARRLRLLSQHPERHRRQPRPPRLRACA